MTRFAGTPSLQPFDGRFAPNVLLQVKNGPIDFQPKPLEAYKAKSLSW